MLSGNAVEHPLSLFSMESSKKKSEMEVRRLALWKGETLSWSQSIEPLPNLLRQKPSG